MLLDRLNLGLLIWLFSFRATSSIVAWLITAVACKLLFGLASRESISGLVLVLVVPRAVVPVVSVLPVSFRANTGIF